MNHYIFAHNLSQTKREHSPEQSFEPSYCSLLRSGEIAYRIQQAYQCLDSDDSRVRYQQRQSRPMLQGSAGFTDYGVTVHCFGPHYGEEPPVSGWRGSGTIFFGERNFSQSRAKRGGDREQKVDPADLACMMLQLQRYGCHNINLVNPSQAVPQILAAVRMAAEIDLSLPLIYNTGSYENVNTLALLAGVIDIYLSDMKCSEATVHQQLPVIEDYPALNRAAIEEMHRQVGDLLLDSQGIAQRGLLIRHQVVPGGLADTEEIFRFIVEKISRHTYLHLIPPTPPLRVTASSPLTSGVSPEYQEALRLAQKYGLQRLYYREEGIL